MIFWCYVGIAAPEELPFTPDNPEPASQTWLWTEIEELSDQGFRAMTNGPDGSVFFGLEQGIYKYDGYTFTHHGEEKGLDSSEVVSLYTSKAGAMYATTRDTMYIFNDDHWLKIHKASFRHLRQPGFAEDADGVVWARWNGGVIRIQGKEAKRITNFGRPVAGVTVDRNNRLWVTLIDHNTLYECPTTLVRWTPSEIVCKTHNNELTTAAEPISYFPYADSSNNIWLINAEPDKRILRYNQKTQTWLEYGELTQENVHSSILETRDGKLFLTTTRGLFVRDDDAWRLVSNTHIKDNHTTISLLESPDNCLWLGAKSGKVFRIDRSKQQFQVHRNLIYQDTSKTGTQWFLGRDDEIVSFNSNTQQWIQYRDTENIIDTPVSLLVTQDQRVIVAGSDNMDAAISVYNGDHWKKHIIKNFAPLTGHLALIQTADKSIYLGNSLDYNVGTKEYPGGMVKILLQNNNDIQIKRYAPPDVPLVVQNILTTSDGSLWLGEKGLYKLEDNRAVFIESPPSLQKGLALHVASDGDKRIWLAKFGNELHSYDSGSWNHHATKQSIGNNSITYILPLANRRLYAASFTGISYYDGNSWHKDFLPRNFKIERNGGTIKIGAEDALWLSYSSEYWYQRAKGGRNNKGYAFPRIRSIQYKPDRFPPIVRIENFSKRLSPGSYQLIIWQGYDKWRRTPNKNLLYSYRLNNSDWSNYSEKTNITFSNLNDGQYHFDLRAKDSDGNVSTQPVSIDFIIVPPIWKQPWFLALVGSMLAAIAGLLIFIIRLREKHLIALEKVRLEFYTNITHELRTPLTIILGPLEKLRREIMNPEHSKLVQLAHKSSIRLMQLVDQVLEIRKIETGNEDLNLEQGDPVLFLKEMTTRYLSMANDKHIQLSLELPENSLLTAFDKDKVQKIVDNLISNAIKYTTANGKIIIRTSFVETEYTNAVKKMFLIEVEDTGIGITPEVQERIFTSYYRAKNDDNKSGFGIGLTYVKQLVDICHGEITLQSPVDKATQSGTIFGVYLPMDAVEATTAEAPTPSPQQDSALNTKAQTIQPANPPLLLIIEDNADIINYLNLEFKNQYSMIEAGDGKQGIDIARSTIPDIILCDVMMPEMDGLQCCRLLKTHQETSHIPVILLTARRSRNHELEGLETGADDYIAKPFNIDVLRARLHNQLENRRKLRARYGINPELPPHAITENATDRAFLKNLSDTIEKHIADPDIDLNKIAEDMNFSRTTLYRKLKALCDQSPTNFIKSARLKKACALLKTGKHNVSEVVCLVGFQDISYFSKCFKAEFGKSPSQFTPSAKNPKQKP